MLEGEVPGDVLGGRYRLIEPLGAGSMARVWLAQHVLTHTAVAIKIIDPEITNVEFNLARFLREAKTLKSIDTQHVVKVLDYGADAETAYLVMELLTGETLGTRLAQRGRLTFGELKCILRDVCSAMSLVHERDLIHRDLKPDNIFLCSTELGVTAKVVDFGIAKPVHEAAPSFRTQTGYVLGTPSYMSPEQCRGHRDVDRRSDLWSLGVIVYECLVGREPFRAEPLAELLLQICMGLSPVPSEQCDVALPVGFDAWFAKAVARERADRFQNADELAAAFAALADPSTRKEPLARRTPSEEPARHQELIATAANPEAKRSSPFEWRGTAALALLLAVGAWLLIRVALAPRPTGEGIDALQPSNTLRSAPAAAPSREQIRGSALTPAAEHDPSARPTPSPPPEANTLASQRVPSSPPPSARSAPPAGQSAMPPSATPSRSPPSPPRRRPPTTDIRTSR